MKKESYEHVIPHSLYFSEVTSDTFIYVSVYMYSTVHTQVAISIHRQRMTTFDRADLYLCKYRPFHRGPQGRDTSFGTDSGTQRYSTLQSE